MSALIAILVLVGCDTPSGRWMYLGDPGASGQVSTSSLYDMKLQRVVTSPIPGATAKLLAPPPGVTYTGAPVGACVTEAGYCPLAAQVEPGQNCLCEASQGMYGGSTGTPPKYNTKTNPW